MALWQLSIPEHQHMRYREELVHHSNLCCIRVLSLAVLNRLMQCSRSYLNVFSVFLECFQNSSSHLLWKCPATILDIAQQSICGWSWLRRKNSNIYKEYFPNYPKIHENTTSLEWDSDVYSNLAWDRLLGNAFWVFLDTFAIFGK